MMPAVVAHYHANNGNDWTKEKENDSMWKCLGQSGTYDPHELKFEPSTSPSHLSNPHHFQVSTPSFPSHPIVDLGQTYINDRSHPIYSSNPMSTMVPLAPTQSVPLATSNPPHQMLGPRYSGGSTGSNVLMLPPTHHPRGGSLPDLRSGNVFSPQQISFSTTPSPPTSTNQQHFFSGSSPHKNGDGDLYVLVNWPKRIIDEKSFQSIFFYRVLNNRYHQILAHWNRVQVFVVVTVRSAKWNKHHHVDKIPHHQTFHR